MKNGEKLVDYCDVVAENAIFEDSCQSFIDIHEHLFTLGVLGLTCLCLLHLLIFAYL